MTILDQISKLNKDTPRQEALNTIDQFLSALERGELRSATHDENGQWRANKAVKEGILTCFRIGQLSAERDGLWSFVDKDTLPTQAFDVERRVRVVPGGSSVRRGAYLAPQVTIMPPAYVNVGAYVDAETMIDSHALVGSCAQIGKRVHLSAAAQIGGVLEPVGATPVIVEDDAFIGGNSGLYEGTIVRKRAVIAAGVVLTRSSIIYDLVNERIVRSENDTPLVVPENAVVVPGSRPARGSFAEKNGLTLQCAVIVKYRDEKTDAKASLESALR